MKDDACCPDTVSPDLLKAMGDPTRLKMLLVLDGNPRSVNEIGKFFRLSQPTITRHLQTLAGAGLVVRTKSAQTVTYALVEGVMRDLCLGLMSCFPCCCGPLEQSDVTISRPKKRARTKYQSSDSVNSKRKGGQT